MSSRNTVVLQGDITTYHDERRVKASTTVKPGQLIEITTGDVVQPHATAGSYAEILVAKEDPLQGRTIDDAYAAAEVVPFHRAQKGDKLQMILKDGQTTALASFLTSNGDGTLKVATSTDERLFKATEIVAASGADAFVSVQVV